METWSLKSKLYLAMIATILSLCTILTWRSYQGISDLSDELSSLTEKNLSTAVVQRLQSDGQAYSEKMSAYLNSAFRLPLSLRAMVAGSIVSKHRLNRDQISDLFEQSLIANPDLSSSYVQFEANGYDGLDANFVENSPIHSANGLGGFELYWFRDRAGKVQTTAVEDPNEKYLATKNEFGLRQAE